MSEQRQYEEAKQILESEVFKAAIRSVSDRIVNEWATTENHEVKRREQLWCELVAAGRVVGELQSVLRDLTIKEADVDAANSNYGIV